MTAPTPRLHRGPRALDGLATLPAVRDAREVAILCGASSLAAGGWLYDVRGALGADRVVVYDGLGREPAPADLVPVVAWLRARPVDVVVAIGGGSVLDVGKAAAFLVRRGGHDGFLACVPKAAPAPLSLVAVPTTAGTGAEVTPFATFWDRADAVKRSLDDPAVVPDDVVLDPRLTLSLPPRLSALSGIDAFTHACEAFWNRRHTPETDSVALAAVALLGRHLAAVVADGSDLAARAAVQEGALLAGLAIAQTRTAACHAISYPLTLRHRVPHGQAVAVTLPAVLLLNAAACEDGLDGDALAAAEQRRRDFCAALDVRSIDDAAAAVHALLERCGLSTRLGPLGVAAADLDALVAEGQDPRRMCNNPHTFSPDGLHALLRRLL